MKNPTLILLTLLGVCLLEAATSSTTTDSIDSTSDSVKPSATKSSSPNPVTSSSSDSSSSTARSKTPAAMSQTTPARNSTQNSGSTSIHYTKALMLTWVTFEVLNRFVPHVW